MRVLAFALFAGLGVLPLAAQQYPGFDIHSLDRTVDPCADFYKFSCGGWMSANPLPSDQSRYGRFDALADRNRIVLQNQLESAESPKPGRTAIEQKIGDFYASCMDEKGIDAHGTSVLKPDLDRITALKTKKDLAAVVAQLFRDGVPVFFNFGSEQDFKDSTKVIAGLDQGGLGMPDRDYYFKTDQKSVDLRMQYVAHVQKMFELLGASVPGFGPAEAAKKAQIVMSIETALADGSFDRVTRRDPEKVYHKMAVSELVTLGPEFDAGSDAFLDTAAVMACCDLIISSDTAVAHLAGALGKPVWTLLRCVPDWSWLLKREESHWYPTMRLYRQQTAGDWRDVFERVAADLRREFS